MTKGRYEQHGQRFFQGRYTEFSVDEQGLDVEVDGSGTYGLTRDDLAWLLGPHVSAYVPSHPAEPPAAETEAWAVAVLDAYGRKTGVCYVVNPRLRCVTLRPLPNTDDTWQDYDSLVAAARALVAADPALAPSKPASETEALKERLLAMARNVRAGYRNAVDYDDEVATIYNAMLWARQQVPTLTPSKVEPSVTAEHAAALCALSEALPDKAHLGLAYLAGMAAEMVRGKRELAAEPDDDERDPLTGQLVSARVGSAAAEPTCSGEWLHGSGGHRMFGGCPKPATWTELEGGAAACDEHLGQHGRPAAEPVEGRWVPSPCGPHGFMVKTPPAPDGDSSEGE